MRTKHISSPKYVELKPVSKFAYYNPAKKDKNGNIGIHQSPTLLWITGCIILFYSILNTIAGEYGVLILTAPVLVVIALIIFIFPPPDVVIVNQTGMTIERKEYPWKDYIGVFYFIAPVGKGASPWALVLVRADGSYDYVTTEAIGSYNKIGTAIRDFQPDYYIGSKR